MGGQIDQRDVRADLEAGGRITHQEAIVGRDGVKQLATKKTLTSAAPMISPAAMRRSTSA
jgi:hypothetical protein